MNTAQGAAGSVAQPPGFTEIDPRLVDEQGVKFDEQGFDLASKVFADKFPGLVAASNRLMSENYADITGPLDPALQNAYARAGLVKGASAFGGAFSTAGTEGSANRNTLAATIGQNVLAHQDSVRATQEELLAENPEQAVGLSGADFGKILIANSIGENQAKLNAYLAAVGQYNEANRVASANESALISLGGSAINAYKRYSTPNASVYGYTDTGAPIYNGTVVNAPGGI